MRKNAVLISCLVLMGCTLCGCDGLAKEIPQEEHMHTYSTMWSTNKDQHWHESTCGHDVQQDLGNHVDLDGDYKCDICDFSLEKPIHIHTFSSQWSTNESQHWHESTCGHDVKDSLGNHIDSDLNGSCDVCGYSMPLPVHEHTYSSQWSFNADIHWHQATCEHNVQTDVANHIDSNADYKCDVCGYQLPIPQPEPHIHTFSPIWNYDEDNHWHDATCEHKDQVFDSFGAHIDVDENGCCDVCEYQLYEPSPIVDYYKNYDLSLEGDLLAKELQKLCFDTHTTFVKYNQYYTYDSFTDDRISCDAAPETVGTSSERNEYFYTGKIATGVGTREHVWPCAASSGLWVHDVSAGDAHYVDGTKYAGGGSDLFHVRPSTSSVNTARGNGKFCDFDDPEFASIRQDVVETGDTGPYKLKLYGALEPSTGVYEYASKVEVADEYKGDIARILVYTWLHYGYRGNDYGHSDMLGNLNFSNVLAYDSEERIFEKLCEWNELDKPSQTEKLRNDTVQGIQGNRNPFVDHPELMNNLFNVEPTIDKKPFVMDFTDEFWQSRDVFPYIYNNTDVNTFKYNDICFLQAGCFVTSYNGEYFLQMKNKWETTSTKATEDTTFSFISNETGFNKPITGIEIITTETGGTSDLWVYFGTEEIPIPLTAGEKYQITSGKNIHYFSNPGKGDYFCITSSVDIGRIIKNCAISKITIFFDDNNADIDISNVPESFNVAEPLDLDSYVTTTNSSPFSVRISENVNGIASLEGHTITANNEGTIKIELTAGHNTKIAKITFYFKERNIINDIANKIGDQYLLASPNANIYFSNGFVWREDLDESDNVSSSYGYVNASSDPNNYYFGLRTLVNNKNEYSFGEYIHTYDSLNYMFTSFKTMFDDIYELCYKSADIGSGTKGYLVDSGYLLDLFCSKLMYSDTVLEYEYTDETYTKVNRLVATSVYVGYENIGSEEEPCNVLTFNLMCAYNAINMEIDENGVIDFYSGTCPETINERLYDKFYVITPESGRLSENVDDELASFVGRDDVFEKHNYWKDAGIYNAFKNIVLSKSYEITYTSQWMDMDENPIDAPDMSNTILENVPLQSGIMYTRFVGENGFVDLNGTDLVSALVDKDGMCYQFGADGELISCGLFSSFTDDTTHTLYSLNQAYLVPNDIAYQLNTNYVDEEETIVSNYLLYLNQIRVLNFAKEIYLSADYLSEILTNYEQIKDIYGIDMFLYSEYVMELYPDQNELVFSSYFQFDTNIYYMTTVSIKCNDQANSIVNENIETLMSNL